MAIDSKNLLEVLKTFIHHYKWWEWTIFIIGLLAFISILVVLFLPLGAGPSVFIRTDKVPPVSQPKFINMISASLNVPQKQGEKITLINNGDDFVKSFLSDIDNAHSSIDIMVYIWTDGKMSDQVFEHLDKKLSQGVQVRIIVDAFGSSTNFPKKQFTKFQGLGGKVTIFNSFTVVPWQLAKNQARNHRRAIVIDGNIGYTGGMTISDPWLGNAQGPKEYRDIMFRATGPMASDIQGAFGQLWTSMTGEFLVGDSFYPDLNILSQKNVLDYIALDSAPSPDTLTLQKLFLLSIYGAQQKIYITTPYFLPDASLRSALMEKAKAGLDVRILLPNQYNDSPSLRHASQYWYEGLLKSGVKIYEYQPTFIHAKTAVMDGAWSIIGSANMDNRSRKINNEVVFGVLNKDLASSLESTFLQDLEKSKQIDLEQWKKRGIWQKWREIFDQKFVQQY